MSKYGAKKTTFQGMEFDSKREAERFAQLRFMQMGRIISDLKCQVKYELIPCQRDEDGKIIERSVSYIADFVYTDRKTGQTVVEDAKGCRTKEYIIKRKLMLHVHGIRIREV